MFGFGGNSGGKLGIKEDKVSKPVKLNHFGDVEFVDAWDKTCTIDQDGNMLNPNGESEVKIVLDPSDSYTPSAGEVELSSRNEFNKALLLPCWILIH